MASNLLENGGFEADWSEGGSHRCLIVPTDGEPFEAQRGNIFTPPGWLTWFRHEAGTWDQPEVRDAWVTGDPRRVHSGQKAILLFTFFRKHDGGFLQQVRVGTGARVKLSAWAHAWSNHKDAAQPNVFPHPDDPEWSEGDGVGYNHFFGLEGEVEDAGARNFTFWVGVDPTGGTDPLAESVVWGRGAHVYNAYGPIPAVETVARGDTVTVFLRSRTLWPFKHNDAYWDDALLELVEPETRIILTPAEPRVQEMVKVTVSATEDYEDVRLVVTDPEGEAVPVMVAPAEATREKEWRWFFAPTMAGLHHIAFKVADGTQQPAEAELTVKPKPDQVWGLPREQYPRKYVLLPPGAGREWVEAILDSGAWDERRWTIGGSADDAGIGALKDKEVIAVNPEAWPSDLEEFFQRYYPRTVYVPLEASSPADLRRKLEEME